jgi:hypothetical protein
MRSAVWVKLVIDGDDSYDAFPCEVPLETNIVDDLKKTIMVEAKHRNARSFDGASLKVYPPGTNPFAQVYFCRAQTFQATQAIKRLSS